MCAAHLGDFKIFKLLIDKGADVSHAAACGELLFAFFSSTFLDLTVV